MNPRGKWQGVLTVARFNWPYYLAALVVALASLAGGLLLPRAALQVVCWVIFAAAGYFLFVSLGITHFIYDRSGLYRWEWLARAISGATIRQALVCHCGFDDVSPALRAKSNSAQWQVLDHFDEPRMTERSIRRARALFPPDASSLASPYNAWPAASDAADAVFGVLAIHELRTEAERCSWFAEARRCLRQNGRVVLVEHVRDVANFLAFGPGFLHFHSPASWRHCWESAGFHSLDEFRVTPFVRVFVLSRS